jgi:hypothetical protein
MKMARVAIFLTGMIGLMMGGLVTMATLKANQDEEAIRTQEALKTEATLLIEQFHAVVEAARKQSPDVPAPGYIVHRGTVKLEQGSPSAIEYLSIADPTYEERLLSSLKEQISTPELRLSGAVLGMVDLPEGGGKKGMFVAVPAGKVTDTLPLEKVTVFLLDPVKAFPGIGKLAISDESAFLFFRNGKVLAHTLPAFVGTDLMRIPDLKESIGNLFLGAQTGFVQRYSPVDGTRQRLAVVRAGTLPFAVGVERKAPPAVFSLEWASEQWQSGAARKNLGNVFVLVACALFLFAGFSSWAARRLRREIEEARNGRITGQSVLSGNAAAAEGEALPPGLADAAEQAVERLMETRVLRETEMRSAGEAAGHLGVQASRVSEDRVTEALARIEKAYALEAVEREVVSVCAEIIGGHAIYYRYQPRIQNLSAVSLSQDIPADPVLKSQIYVRKDIEQQVEQFAASGKAASLTHYAPLKKMMQSHFEGAAYEAWAVTTTPEVSGKSSMVGVLILLHAGEVGPAVRPVLAKILRESGNFLHVLGNKITPKGTGKGKGIPGRVVASVESP